MTKKQAIRKSILHYRKMIRWVKTQNPDDPISTDKMIEAINDCWGDLYCPLCLKYHKKSVYSCGFCPIHPNCTKSGSLWIQIFLSNTWGKWLEAAKQLLKMLNRLYAIEVKKGK